MKYKCKECKTNYLFGKKNIACKVIYMYIYKLYKKYKKKQLKSIKLISNLIMSMKEVSLFLFTLLCIYY